MSNSLIPFADGLGLLGSFVFKNKRFRVIILILNLLSVLAGGIVLLVLTIQNNAAQLAYFKTNTLPFFGALPLFSTLAVILYLGNTKDYSEIQLNRILEERKEITQKIENETKHDIFNTIQLSLNQLNEYYTINKVQARSSFAFSILAIIAGLVTLLAGVWFYYFKVREIQIAYIAGVSSAILEFIGGASFFIYKRSLDQVNVFFGQLIKVQDTMLAIDLAKHNENAEKRSDLEERIIISLLERSLK